METQGPKTAKALLTSNKGAIFFLPDINLILKQQRLREWILCKDKQTDQRNKIAISEIQGHLICDKGGTAEKWGKNCNIFNKWHLVDWISIWKKIK